MLCPVQHRELQDQTLDETQADCSGSEDRSTPSKTRSKKGLDNRREREHHHNDNDNDETDNIENENDNEEGKDCDDNNDNDNDKAQDGGGSSSSSSSSSSSRKHDSEEDCGQWTEEEEYGTHLLHLDDYTLERIAAHLDIVALSRLAQTCRRLHQLRWPTVDLSVVIDAPNRISSTIPNEAWEQLLARHPVKLVVACRFAASWALQQPMRILRMRSLRDLRLQRIHIPFHAVSELCYALRCFKPHLTRFELNCVTVSTKALRLILANMQEHVPMLSHLTLHAVSLRPEIVGIMAAMVQGSRAHEPVSAQQGPGLRVLEIKNCTVHTLTPLAKALAGRNALQQLSIVAPSSKSRCSVGPIYRSLASNRSAQLVSLDLAHGNYAHAHVPDLLGFLSTTSSLRHLVLPPIQLERDELALIVETLSNRDMLVSFAWCGVSFDVVAAEALWGWVEHSQKLTRLSLTHCDIAGPRKVLEQLAKAAARAFSPRCALRQLDMTGSELFASRSLRRNILPLAAKRRITVIHDASDNS
ncbi:hypothetical protein PTSG_04230 [Salpingoeca rosetta]|uniref:F-box domain-containing protein n=1 Tax=Salpingoeca rosetta (strain ATCC 50818 / BSB-021) TaxID=946362 RepID=F2U6Z0_SALR5|nr:uncharacterized protein PTSG_04230 [Salpingoeca rosetta]EGD83622.1 hypothetical protein PTSG_04230 [Salpingoeca rosetta]|eukprot:XP_004995126.1 hypothetical protein PTSG_04230 [Salpingoeca rosetta]